jgi:hypothetical protein
MSASQPAYTCESLHEIIIIVCWDHGKLNISISFVCPDDRHLASQVRPARPSRRRPPFVPPAREMQSPLGGGTFALRYCRHSSGGLRSRTCCPQPTCCGSFASCSRSTTPGAPALRTRRFTTCQTLSGKVRSCSHSSRSGCSS